MHAVVERTLREPPGAVTHWTGRAIAKAMSLSLRTIQRIWAAHKLQPHLIRTFKRSTDPDFAAKLDDVVGLSMNPPRHAVVVSIDEKSQIQALDRTQPATLATGDVVIYYYVFRGRRGSLIQKLVNPYRPRPPRLSSCLRRLNTSKGIGWRGDGQGADSDVQGSVGI